MLKHCQKSCGICHIMNNMAMDPAAIINADVPNVGCRDLSDKCEEWAIHEEQCFANPGYMNVKVICHFFLYKHHF